MITLAEALKSDSQRRAFFAQLNKGGGGRKGTFTRVFGQHQSPNKKIAIISPEGKLAKGLQKRGSDIRKVVAKSIKAVRSKNSDGSHFNLGKTNSKGVRKGSFMTRKVGDVTQVKFL